MGVNVRVRVEVEVGVSGVVLDDLYSSLSCGVSQLCGIGIPSKDVASGGGTKDVGGGE